MQYKTTEVSFFFPVLGNNRIMGLSPGFSFQLHENIATYASSNQKGRVFFLVGKSKILTFAVTCC